MTGTLSTAADTVGISYRTVHNHLASDPVFKEMFESAEEEFADRAEAELIERAMVGTDKNVYDRNGNITGVEKVKSDGLLKMLVTAAKPEKYGKRTEVNVSGQIEHQVIVDAKNNLLEKFNKIIDVTPKKKELIHQEYEIEVEDSDEEEDEGE